MKQSTRTVTWKSKMVRNYSIIQLFFWVCFAFHSVCFAAEMADYELLVSWKSGIDRPTQIAVDRQQNVYISETAKDYLLILDSNGKRFGTVSGLDKPVSVAVGSDGRVYVGNLGRGNVEVYDSTLSFLFCLGNGTDGNGSGEFEYPSDIEVDSSGCIFVADKGKSTITKYDNEGVLISLIGEPGNGEGQFNEPVSLVIDSINNELVVIDRQMRDDQLTNTLIKGARIQILELDGSFLRGYNTFGYNRDEGQLIVPGHLEIDNESRIYVSDARLQKIMVYDYDGSFLGMIDSESEPFRTPMGIALSDSGELYVSSIAGGKIDIYGVRGQMSFDVSPSFLNFVVPFGEDSDDVETIVITNTSAQLLNWEASSDSSWLTISTEDGTIAGDGQTELYIEIESSSLEAGFYTGIVTIQGEGTITENVTVDLEVQFEGELTITPAVLNFETIIGTTPPPQAFSITHTDGLAENWVISTGSDWLDLESFAGTTPSNLRVYPDISSLSPGNYTGTISILTTDGSNLQGNVVVNMELSAADDSGYEHYGYSFSKKWLSKVISSNVSLNGVWGSSKENIFVVGDNGTILHFDGNYLQSMESGVVCDLFSIWGHSDSEIYITGDNGTILTLDNGEWTLLSLTPSENYRGIWSGSTSDVFTVSIGGKISRSLSVEYSSNLSLLDIWGINPQEIYAVGEKGTILHFQHSGWHQINSNTAQWLKGVWGLNERDVFAVGENGTIVHFDGQEWRVMDSGTKSMLNSIYGNISGEIYAVGANGVMLYYSNGNWQSIASKVSKTLNDVWVSSDSEVFAVGSGGLLVHGAPAFPWNLFLNSLINRKTVKKEKAINHP